MKKFLFLSSLSILTLVSGRACAQFCFGVSPGPTFNSALFGYKTGRVETYVGFQHAGLNMQSTVSSRRYNFSTSQMEDYSNEANISGALVTPSIGMKFFFINQNKLKAYGNAMVSKPIVVGRYTYNGEADTLFNDVVASINLWSGEMGFGTEYFFDSQFSIGGEFGFRPVIARSTVSEEGKVYNYNTGLYENVTTTYTNNVNFSPTYAKITLNFYFNKKDKS